MTSLGMRLKIFGKKFWWEKPLVPRARFNPGANLCNWGFKKKRDKDSTAAAVWDTIEKRG